MTPAQAILQRIEVASPCPARWEGMVGDEQTRLCALCDKQVYDLSRMSAEEAVVLFREKEGRLCVRLWKRPDGRVLTTDCPLGARWLKRRIRLRWGAARWALVWFAAWQVGCLRTPVASFPASAVQVDAEEPARFSYEGRTLKAVVVIKGRGRNGAGCTVGVMGTAPALDMERTAHGLVLSHEDWEHLPLR